jgi:hypothetical protein
MDEAAPGPRRSSRRPALNEAGRALAVARANSAAYQQAYQQGIARRQAVDRAERQSFARGRAPPPIRPMDEDSSENDSSDDDNPDDVPEFSLGAMDQLCPFCAARLFRGEFDVGNGAQYGCCNSGQVVLERMNALPADLLALFLGSNIPLSRLFFTDVRKYNNAFSFASLQCNLDHRIAGAGRGPPQFRISGQLHHMMGPLLPPPALLPNGQPNPAVANFASIYFLDDANERRALRISGSHLQDVANNGTIMDTIEGVMAGNRLLAGTTLQPIVNFDIRV